MLPKAPSKTLIKLVDLAVIPAAILIFTKVISILVLNAVLNLSWDVRTFSDAFFGIRLIYTNPEDLNMVISYSNLFMHLAALTGTLLALSKLFYFHPKFVKPNVVLKLAKSDNLHLIQSVFHLYEEGVVWSVFLVVSDIIILFNFMQNLTYNWTFGVSIFTTLVTLFVLVRSIDRDINVKNIKYK